MLTLVDGEYTTVFIVFITLCSIMYFLYGSITKDDDDE